MKDTEKSAIFGGILGALIAFGGVWVADAAGVLPLATDARLHSYLMNHASVVYDMAAKAETDQAKAQQESRKQAIKKVGIKAFFDPKIAYVTGPANAKNTFVVFFDYNCVHCRNSASQIKTFYDKHKGDTRFAFIEMPIFGADSTMAASVAIAAREQNGGQNYLPLFFKLMGEKKAIDADVLFKDAAAVGLNTDALSKDISAKAVQAALDGGHTLAQKVSITGTPAFIINGQMVDGEMTSAEMEKMIK